ncbi:MAG: OadG family protein [Clostridia bacterium]|nr:OadG family protein [Clostridia bacterium]
MNLISLAIWKGGSMTVPESLGIALVGILVVLAELALLALFITILSKIIGAFTKKKKAEEQETTVTPVAETGNGTPAPAAGYSGSPNLINVDEPTAACIMAIVSDRSGIPLERLKFRSIKLLEDK